LTATARAIYLAADGAGCAAAVIVVVADNKAADALEPMLRAGCELTGAVDPRCGAAAGPRCAPFRKSYLLIPMCKRSGGGVVEAGHWGGLDSDCAGGVAALKLF